MRTRRASASFCTFTGRVSDDDLCRILSSADVAVDPDPKTAWSDKSTMNKIMEYMFFGLPIVCYDLTEHKVSAQDAAALCGRELGTGTGRGHQRPSGRSRRVARACRGTAPSGCARSSCGSTRCRLCWQPTMQIFARLRGRCERARRSSSGSPGTDFWRGCRGRRGPRILTAELVPPLAATRRAHLPPTFARSPRATFRIVSAARERGPGRFRGCRTPGFELDL